MSTKNPESSSTAQQGESQASSLPQSAPQDFQQQTRTGNTVKSGPLFISSKGIGWTSWKKRWFILTTNSLIFYRNDPNAAAQKSGEMNLILGGIDLNNSGSVEVKPDKKLLTVLFSDARDGRAFTLKAETLEDLHEWKHALETALAQAPSASTATGQNGTLTGEQVEADNSSSEQQKDGPAVKYMVIGRPILLALEESDGTPSFLEKALQFIEDHGVRTEGILRQAADVDDVERRVHEYEQGKTDFSPEEDAHVIGDCIKHVLRELPSSPVPASCCTALLQAFRTDRSKRVNCMRIAILETFPEPNRKLLQRLLVMMQAVIAQKQVNRMSTSAAAACMAPLLLRPLLAGECEVENQHMEMAGDSSLQLLQAAAAANHAQAIIITLLDEYDKIFGNANQASALSSELFSEEEGEESGSEEETEYEEDDEEMYEDEDEDNEYASDEEDVEGEEDEDQEGGSDEEEGDTDDDYEEEGSEISEGGHPAHGDSVGQKAKAEKNHPTESIELSPEEEKEIKSLEAEKKHLEMQVAREAKGKDGLLSILGRRKKSLHERRLALEREVVRTLAELQNEKDLKAALDTGLGISDNPPPDNVDAKTEEKDTDAEEDGKQKVDDPGMHHSPQSEENNSATSDRSIQPSEVPSQETKSTNKPKVNEAGTSSHTADKSGKSKGQQTINTDGAHNVNEKKHEPPPSSNKSHNQHGESARSISMRIPSHTSVDAGLPKPMSSSVSRKFNSKAAEQGNSNTFTLSKLTTRLNFLKEKRNQIANELQNLDKGTESGSGHSPRKAEKGQHGQEGSSSQTQEGSGSQSHQYTEAGSSNHDVSKKSHVTKSASVAHIGLDRAKAPSSEAQKAHHPERAKPGESRSMRKRII